MYVCTWFNKKLNRFKIDNIKPDGKVSDFKNLAIDAMNKKCQDFEFTYRGNILKDDKCLSDYEINENSEIHVIEKLSSMSSAWSPFANTEEEVQNIVSTFRVLTQNPGFRSNVQRIVKSGTMNDVHKAVPDIAKDTTALSILLDPELLIHLADPDTVRLLREKHPSLIHAVGVLAKHLHDQNNSIHQQPTTSTGYSYSLDALSDDEDMDSNTESSRNSHPITRNSSFNAITSAQLAAAIANATNTAFNTNSAGIPTTPTNTPNIITNEMFSSALQQAFSTTPIGSPPVTPGENEETSFSSLSVRFENELRQMHELGLLNDTVNIRALQTTSGNLQEAVELVLNGVLD
ncbi:hypothetical protein HHI36_022897 [Cryptolaemus montrouzieri]|uniref:Ubiquitin-like protein 7 n=1 Tax=Cryptolaemus montrouzieri TaxID=559131 RepID=A0ABD2PER4_9CUCU